MENREMQLRRRLRLLTWFFIVGLVLSGVTAIPLEWELDALAKLFAGTSNQEPVSGLEKWILKVSQGLHETNVKFPFMAYGTDWLAFGHFAIAIAFVGALRDPVRNCWLFDFGLIACVLVVPFALCLGGIRSIPILWRLIDCSTNPTN
jgi:hypothetical protein